MPTRIKQLKCRVSVKTGHKMPLLHQDDKPIRPTMQYALPKPEPRTEAGQPEPSQMATEERGGAAGAKHRPEPRKADARVVADRVYDIMKQEIVLARQRGLVGRRG